ncbi:hypothetical protein GCM10022397_32610 [Flavivirga jejuensis]
MQNIITKILGSYFNYNVSSLNFYESFYLDKKEAGYKNEMLVALFDIVCLGLQSRTKNTLLT